MIPYPLDTVVTEAVSDDWSCLYEKGQLLSDLYNTLSLSQLWLKLCVMIWCACMKKPAVVRFLSNPPHRQLWPQVCLMIWGGCMKKPAVVRFLSNPPLRQLWPQVCLMIGDACMKKPAVVWPIWYPSPSTVVFKAVYDDWRCLYENASCCQTCMIPFPLDSCDRSCVWWLEVPVWKSQLLSDFYDKLSLRLLWSKVCLMIGGACIQNASCCLTSMITYPLDSCDQSCTVSDDFFVVDFMDVSAWKNPAVVWPCMIYSVVFHIQLI